MSEESKPVRTLNEIQQAYGSECAKAGEIQYRMFCLQKDVEMLGDSLERVNQAIRDLNIEAASVKPVEPPKEQQSEKSES